MVSEGAVTNTRSHWMEVTASLEGDYLAIGKGIKCVDKLPRPLFYVSKVP